MVAEYQNSNLTHVADRSLLFMPPGTRFTCHWRGGEGAVMHIQFRPAFLEEVALLSRVEPGASTNRRSRKYHSPSCSPDSAEC